MEKINVTNYKEVSYPSEPGKTRKLWEVICPTCGKKYYFRKSDIPIVGWECKKCHYNRHTKIVTCSTCGRKIKKAISKLKNSRSGLYFCNRKCKEKQQAIGGLLELPHYGSDTEYRQKAFLHYGAKCSDCDETKEHRLVVHHIDGDRHNNTLDNLIVLCHNHHSDRHAKKINDKTVFDCHYINEDYI